MKPRLSLRKALNDKLLLGKSLTGDSWQAWRVLLIAAMGEKLTNDERELFKQLTNREHEPEQRRGIRRRDRKTRRQIKGHLCSRNLHFRPVSAPELSAR
jgi:hypothetical protein